MIVTVVRADVQNLERLADDRFTKIYDKCHPPTSKLACQELIITPPSVLSNFDHDSLPLLPLYSNTLYSTRLSYSFTKTALALPYDKNVMTEPRVLIGEMVQSYQSFHSAQYICCPLARHRQGTFHNFGVQAENATRSHMRCPILWSLVNGCAEIGTD
jgi:hypothetical protein